MANHEFSLLGREVSPITKLIVNIAAALGGLAGAAMAITSLTPVHVWPWQSPSSLTPLLIGAGLIGVIPALLAISRASLWENVRIVMSSVAVIVVGLAVVSVLGPFILHTSKSSGLVSFLWLLGIVPLALSMPVAFIAQRREPGLDLPYGNPFPRVTIPLVALLGASHVGLGLGLLGAPKFWGNVVPWDVNGTDARALGVWCLGLGVGLMYALAENDVLRARVGAISMLGIGAAEIVAYALGAGQMQWASWAGLSAIGLAIWLFFTGVVGLALAGQATPQHELESELV